MPLTSNKPSNHSNATPLWTRDFLLVMASNLAVFLGFNLLLPTLPIYVDRLGGNEIQVGLITGIFTLSAVVVRPWVGADLDRRGRRGLLLAGLATFIVAAFAYNFAATISLLLLIRVLHGAGWGASTTAAGTVAADIIPGPRRAEGMGYFGFSGTLAMTVGPAAGILMIEQLGFTHLFAASALLGVLSLGLAWAIVYPPPAAGLSRPNFFEKRAVPPAAVMSLTAVSFGAFVSFITLLMKQRSIPGTGHVFTILAAALILTRPLAGIIVDRKGPSPVVVPGGILVTAGLLILAQAHSLAGALAFAAVYGVGFGMVQPTLQALSIDLVPSSNRGAATAVFFSAFDLGIGLGAMALGPVAQFFGYEAAFLTAAIVNTLAVALYLAGRGLFERAREARG